MALGKVPYLLRDIATYAGQATPSMKVDAHGLTAMTLANAAANPIVTQEVPGDGTDREVRIKKRQRLTKLQTSASAATCDHVLTPARSEETITIDSVISTALYLKDSLLAQYERESMKNQPVGTLNGVSKELVEIMYSAANGLLKGLNDALWAKVAYGKNVVSGTSTYVTLNLPQAVGTQPLTSGMSKLLYDYQRNSLTGRPQAVGTGLFHAYALTQPYKFVDSFGANSSMAMASLDFWPDEDLPSKSGASADSLVVFEPGSIQLIERLEYTGDFGGTRPGASEFGVVKIPVNVNGRIALVSFDVQLKYFDCDTTLTDLYTDSQTTYSKGYALIMKKDYNLWQLPSDSYDHMDPKRSVNGALAYTITNS